MDMLNTFFLHDRWEVTSLHSFCNEANQQSQREWDFERMKGDDEFNLRSLFLNIRWTAAGIHGLNFQQIQGGQQIGQSAGFLAKSIKYPRTSFLIFEEPWLTPNRLIMLKNLCPGA